MSWYKCQRTGRDSIRYLHAGQGKPLLVFLHGFGFPPHYYAGMLDRLSERFEVIAPMISGVHYLKQAQPRTIDECAACTVEFLEALGLKEYHLAGHSIGAAVAYRVAQASRAAVTLTGLNPVQPVRHRQAGFIIRGLAKHAVEAVGLEGGLAGARFALATFLPCTWNLARDFGAAWALIGSIATFRYEQPAPDIPATFFQSDRDEYFPRLQAGLQEIIPRVIIRPLHDRNHDWPLLQPAEAAAELTDLLDRGVIPQPQAST